MKTEDTNTTQQPKRCLELFILLYKATGQPKEAIFQARDSQSANLLAHEWCKEKNYRYIHVNPFLVNISGELESIRAARKVEQESKDRKIKELANVGS